MKKILGSLLTISALMAVVFGASSAFFSDTETSNNNSFTAGSIDLKVDAQVNQNANSSGSVLAAQDLGGTTIFTYTDLKPGDFGNGFLSFHGEANDYWACTRSTTAVYGENGILDPETEAGDVTVGEGELQTHVQFAFWNDGNQNGVWDQGVDANLVGPWLEDNSIPWITPGLYRLPGLVNAGWIPLADTSLAAFFSATPLAPVTPHYLGYAYCFGQMTYDETNGGPLGCNGVGSFNDAQGDGMSSTMEFYAVQSRNNPNFTCQSLNPTPTPTPTP